MYNGILSKMRKEYEKEQKALKIKDIRETLRTQILEQKAVKQRELQEKQKFDTMVAKTVQDDKRTNERIKLERQRKIDEEKALRDEQLYLEHRKKEMFREEKRDYESGLVAKLQKEIKVS